MKINLRKASILINQLQAAISTPAQTTSVRYLKDAELFKNTVNTFVDDYYDKVTQVFKVISTLYWLRTEVASQNSKKGINDLLTQVAEINTQEKALSSPKINNWGMPSSSISIDEIEAWLKSIEGSENPLSVVSVDLVSKTHKDDTLQAVSALKKKRNALNEEISKKNLGTFIEIPEDHLTVLSSLDLM